MRIHDRPTDRLPHPSNSTNTGIRAHRKLLSRCLIHLRYVDARIPLIACFHAVPLENTHAAGFRKWRIVTTQTKLPGYACVLSMRRISVQFESKRRSRSPQSTVSARFCTPASAGVLFTQLTFFKAAVVFARVHQTAARQISRRNKTILPRATQRCLRRRPFICLPLHGAAALLLEQRRTGVAENASFADSRLAPRTTVVFRVATSCGRGRRQPRINQAI